MIFPGVGLAYGISTRTVIRSGYGIFWIPKIRLLRSNPLNDMVNAASTRIQRQSTGITDKHNCPSFPAGISGRPAGVSHPGDAYNSHQVVQSITEHIPNHPAGYVQQWN